MLKHTYKAEYEIWKSAKQRCHNPRQSRYADYGGRGIFVSDEWRESFDTFIADMGPRPEPSLFGRFTLERVDNNGSYSRENCRWATYVDQANNARKSGLVKVTEAGLSPLTYKYCCTCKRVLPKSNFHALSYVSPKRKTSDGLRPECITCKRDSSVKYRARKESVGCSV